MVFPTGFLGDVISLVEKVCPVAFIEGYSVFLVQGLQG
jgi:hypothetical protein